MAREMVSMTGESITSAVTESLRHRLNRLKVNKQVEAEDKERLLDELMEIAHRCAQLPVRSTESEDETLGYDKSGIPESPSNASSW